MKDFTIDLQLFAEDSGNTGLLSGEDTGTEEKGGEGGLLSQDDNTDSGSDDSTNQGTNEKPEGDSDGKKEENKEDKPAGAPEKYEAFTVPEGFKIEDSAVKEFGDLARELNLTQEAAQKLVDYQVKFQQANYAKLDELNKKQSEEWAAETMKSFKKEDLADARRGFKSAPKEVQQMLATCGFDNHKAFVDFFMKVGRSLKEDKFETGKGRGGSDKPTANVIYPELN